MFTGTRLNDLNDLQSIINAYGQCPEKSKKAPPQMYEIKHNYTQRFLFTLARPQDLFYSNRKICAKDNQQIPPFSNMLIATRKFGNYPTFS